jgi:hypothetical protein
MENQSSKQKVYGAKKVLSVAGTCTPVGYDNSMDSFNEWTAYIRQQVHQEFRPTARQIQYQNLFKNVRRN